VLFCGMTVVLGFLFLGAGVLLLRSSMAAPPLHLTPLLARLLGAAFALAGTSYIAFALLGGGRLSIRGWSLAMPPGALAAAQAVIGTLSFACDAACLHAAVSAFSDADYAQVAVAYLVGNGAALLVHAPGGLGVMETAILVLVPHGRAGLLGAVVLFRAIYYLLPLAVGLIVFAISETVFRSRAAQAAGQGTANAAQQPQRPLGVDQPGAEHRTDRAMLGDPERF
jgi:uncharacterized membrane protein YbhN (UPF0104 family)